MDVRFLLNIRCDDYIDFGDYKEALFTSKHIMEVIPELFENKIYILGGDVYKIVDGKITSTSDGWYIDDAPQKKDVCYKKTVSFLKQYEKNNKGDFLFAMVLCDEDKNRVEINDIQ